MLCSELATAANLGEDHPALIHAGRPDGYLDYFNKRWMEYLGVSLDDVEGWIVPVAVEVPLAVLKDH